jgi:hypothetical protein
MKTNKIIPGLCLIVLLVASFTPAAQAALVKNPGQPVTLQASSGSDPSGYLSFSKLNRIKADGAIEPFVLPPNQSIVITWVQLGVTAVDTSLKANVDLRMGPYYSRALTMINGNAGLIDGLDPGFRINATGFSDPRYNNFYAVNLKNDGIIPGAINVRLIGYLVPLP